MEQNIKSKGGFAIIEIIISLVLVSFVLIAVVAVFPKMTAQRKVISEVDQAHVLAMQAMERVQFLSQTAPYAANAKPNPGYTSQRLGNTTFTIDFSNVVNNASIKTTTVTVSWRKGNKTHRSTLTGAVR